MRPRPPWRGARTPVDLRKLPQRLWAFDPGVMGDLVVAEKHRVDRRPAAVEILDRGRHLQLALEHVRVGAKERVREPAAVHPRLDLEAPLLRLLPDLRHDLLDHEDERAGDVVGIGEKGEVVLADAAFTLLAHGAHRDHRVRRITRVHVRPARPVCIEQALAVRVPLLDRRRVLGATTRPPCLSLSHQRNAGMSSFVPCRIPDCIAPVCDDQSHSQRSWCGSRSQPGGHRRCASVRIARTSTS